MRHAWLLAMLIAPAFAHHSFQMFDPVHQKTLEGTVTQFRWTNPHTVIVLSTGTATWNIELTSPGNLRRWGWTRHTLAAGDKISADILPLRDGEHGGALVQVRLPSGAVMSASGK